MKRLPPGAREVFDVYSSPLRRLAWIVLLSASSSFVCSGCCSTTQRPRTRQDIFQERQQLNTLYLTPTGQRVTSAASPAGAVLAGDKQELAWPAWQCNNPACPGRNADGTPLLFPRPHPLVELEADGTIGIRQTESAEDMQKLEAFSEPQCPRCLAQRQLDEETQAQREQYAAWCQPHILPETAKRLRELDAEYRALTEREVQRRQQSGSK